LFLIYVVDLKFSNQDCSNSLIGLELSPNDELWSEKEDERDPIEAEPVSFSHLPYELILEIGDHLSETSRASLGNTCRSNRAILRPWESVRNLQQKDDYQEYDKLIRRDYNSDHWKCYNHWKLRYNKLHPMFASDDWFGELQKWSSKDSGCPCDMKTEAERWEISVDSWEDGYTFFPSVPTNDPKLRWKIELKNSHSWLCPNCGKNTKGLPTCREYEVRPYLSLLSSKPGYRQMSTLFHHITTGSGGIFDITELLTLAHTEERLNLKASVYSHRWYEFDYHRYERPNLTRTKDLNLQDAIQDFVNMRFDACQHIRLGRRDGDKDPRNLILRMLDCSAGKPDVVGHEHCANQGQRPLKHWVKCNECFAEVFVLVNGQEWEPYRTRVLQIQVWNLLTSLPKPTDDQKHIQDWMPRVGPVQQWWLADYKRYAAQRAK
jgi:hypothetical protein